MGLVLASGVGDDDPVGVPLIGWHNVVTTSNIATTTAATGFPATNMANPATHLKWKGGVNTGSEVITITTNTTDEIDYVAVAGHNWGTLAVPITINTQPVPDCLLHLDTNFSDSSAGAHVFTAVGNAAITAVAANIKFGAGAAIFDGAGDYLTGDGSSDFAFATGDWTIDFWVKLNSTGAQKIIYEGRPAGLNGAYPTIYIHAGGTVRYFTNGVDAITGTTVTTTGQYYHVAVTRSGTSTRLFVNGTQEGSTLSDSQTYLNPAGRPAIGTGSTLGSSVHDGWLDELRVLKGDAAWTANFTPPTAAYTATGAVITAETLSNDDPVIFRFSPAIVPTITITLAASGLSPPEAAVIYVGSLLVLERSITIGRGHVPITYGRRTNIISGMSETGNFLGRIVLGEYRESKAEFEWFTPDFYRSDIDDFLAAAQEIPFFWAWSPDEYPDEVGYVWLTNNAEPEVDPVTRRIALELQMRGIA